MTWHIVLDDGSRHPLTSHQISYQIGDGKQIKSGTIDGDPEALSTALEDSNVFLENLKGQRHPVHVTFERGEWKIYNRAL